MPHYHDSHDPAMLKQPPSASSVFPDKPNRATDWQPSKHAAGRLTKKKRKEKKR